MSGVSRIEERNEQIITSLREQTTVSQTSPVDPGSAGAESEEAQEE